MATQFCKSLIGNNLKFRMVRRKNKLEIGYGLIKASLLRYRQSKRACTFLVNKILFVHDTEWLNDKARERYYKDPDTNGSL
jgi:hypothetical protein